MVLLDGILLPLLILLMTRWGDIRKLDMTPIGMAILAFTAPVVHMVVGNPRWQVVALYILHGLVGAIALFLSLSSGKYKVSVPGVRKFAVVLTGLSLVSMVLAPIQVQQPSLGPYTVGKFSETLALHKVQEYYNPEVNDDRQVQLQVYYPAETIGWGRADLFENPSKKAAGLAGATRVWYPFISHLNHLKSSAWYGAPVSRHPSKFPLIVISHGWKGFGDLHAFEAQRLASMGYVVVAIDHTYVAASTTFDDGTSQAFNPNTLLEGQNDQVFRKSAQQLIQVMTKDIQGTLDYFQEKLTRDHPLFGRVDMERVGLIGHSIGGSAALSTSIQDKRIDAVLGMDSFVWAMEEEMVMAGMTVPYLHLRSDQWKGRDNDLALTRMMAGTYADSWLFTIKGTAHSDFTAIADLSPVSRWFGYTGSLDPAERHEIMDKVIMDFFEFSLRGRNTRYQLSALAHEFENLELTTFTRE